MTALDAIGLALTLKRLTETWPLRAGVRQRESWSTLPYDLEAPDFLDRLLPFKDHPLYCDASGEMRQRILACGWIAYNEKTVAIESHIVSPACRYVIDQEIPTETDERFRQALAQIAVDEAYHVLLVLDAARVAREHRDLLGLRLPQFRLVSKMQAAEEEAGSAWKRRLIRVLCAIVSEVSISDYLALLSTDATIQPLNRLTTEIHRKDEAAHSVLFKLLARHMYQRLSGEQRRFTVDFLPRAINWFADLELDVWRSILQQIGFKGAERLIDECKAAREVDVARRDYSALSELAQDLGFTVASGE